ncbi:hypothetical protein [Spirosoma sp. 48-14]|uniref:DUF6932 family protein n=1 Tax=Spirosoma sp. 48-14 TaxID=1895854 RepID=UPI000961776E|nr:hypothetical protein [Spirosoma sp. 48-14]OJW74911.1 MAG: hypothetical protein BGO59_05280 [Spirosoma sp. 48-14]
MPIPDFDHNYVLPPHLGDPTEPSHLSPYSSSILEICQKFGTSPNRVQILKNLVEFRRNMTNLGIIEGFQWLGGSFMQDIETLETRAPRDLDIVTFHGLLTTHQFSLIIHSFPEFRSSVLSKKNFLLDHYPVDYCFKPEVTVEHTRYWIQLFTHTRLGLWKGMVRIELNTPFDDQAALDYLNSI